MKVKGFFAVIAIAIVGSWLGLFIAVPNVLVLITSFLENDPQGFFHWQFSTAAYHQVFDPLFWRVFLHSFEMSFKAMIICLTIAFPFSYWLCQFSSKVRGWLLFLTIVPFWTNSLARAYAIKFILGKKGLVNSTLLFIGVIDKPLKLLYSEFAVIFGLVYVLLPFMILPLYASLEKLDKNLLSAARDLGANGLQRMWYIVIPLSMPGILAGCLAVFLPAMGMFYISDLLGGAKNLLLGNLIKTEFLSTQNWPYGAAMSISLIVLMAGMLFIYYKAAQHVQKRGEFDV